MSPKLDEKLSKINVISVRNETSLRKKSSDEVKRKIELDSLCPTEGDGNLLESEGSAERSSPSTTILPCATQFLSNVSSSVAAELQYDPSLSALKNQHHRLRREAAERNQYISELQAELKRKDDILKKLTRRDATDRSIDRSEVKFDPEYTGVKSSYAVRHVRMALSPTLRSGNMSTNQTNCNLVSNSAKMKVSDPPVADLQENQDEMVIQLRNDLDSKLVELEQMRMFHEIEIDLVRSSCESSIFETHEEMTLSEIDVKPPIANTNGISNKINKFEIKSLVSELKRLKVECNEMRRSSTAAIHVANDALERNCNTIMRYVHEEVDCTGRNNACTTLQKKLEDAQFENLNLKAEISRLLEEGADEKSSDKNSQKTTGDGETKTPTPLRKRESFMSQLSPLPTMESWATFCNRFKEALAGNDQGLANKNVLLDANGVEKANHLFNELCFAKDSTPFEKGGGNAGYHCGKDEDDVFMDAASTLEGDINL